MSGDAREALSELRTEAEEELQRAVEHHDAVTVLSELAWTVETSAPLVELADIERRLEPADAARWRAALRVAENTAVEIIDDDDQDPNP